MEKVVIGDVRALDIERCRFPRDELRTVVTAALDLTVKCIFVGYSSRRNADRDSHPSRYVLKRRQGR